MRNFFILCVLSMVLFLGFTFVKSPFSDESKSYRKETIILLSPKATAEKALQSAYFAISQMVGFSVIERTEQMLFAEMKMIGEPSRAHTINIIFMENPPQLNVVARSYTTSNDRTEDIMDWFGDFFKEVE